MNIIKNMKVGRAITLSVIVPALVALFFASQLIMKEYKLNKSIANLHVLAELSVKVSDLVHEQQKERGATAVFVGSNGQKFSYELAVQRKLTNKKISDLKAFTSHFDSAEYGNIFEGKYNDLFTT